MATATKALAALRQEGLVEAVRGVGTIVRAPGGAAAPRVPKDRPSRRPAAQTKDAIVAAAITVADAEGIDGLSMRRVATGLEVSTMALYRHVTGKDALVTVMVDHIYTEHALPEPPPADRRPALEPDLLTEWRSTSSLPGRSG